MAQVWKRMITIYGHKWSSQYGAAIDGERLSDAAKTWQIGLRGVSVEQVGSGFSALVLSNADWPPSLPEFRRLCLAGGADVLSLDEVAGLLATVGTRSGSVAERYVHPLAFAVSCQCDMHFVRTARLGEVRQHVAKVYERLIDCGWDGWPDYAFDVAVALPVLKKPREVDVFRAFKAGLRV
jgi:hypothetical protein